MKKKITIHKANELVRGGDRYSVFAKRLLNTLYLTIQKSNAFNADYMIISFAYIRNFMNLEKEQNYVGIMKQSFEELQQPLQLNNFKDPRTGEEWNWFCCSFIDEVGFTKSENGQWVAKVKVNSLIKYLMARQKNFTKLELIPYMNRMRTKYSMKLYEYLMSFKNYYYIEITQKHLMRLFGIAEDDKTYKNYSDLKRLLMRQLNEIAKKTDLKEVELQDNTALSKQKIFRVKIHKKKTKEMQEKPGKELIQEMLEKMVKPMRF